MYITAEAALSGKYLDRMKDNKAVLPSDLLRIIRDFTVIIVTLNGSISSLLPHFSKLPDTALSSTRS